MPKIFALRHQLAEQQARLKQQAKTGSLDLSVNGNNATAASNSSSSSSDEDNAAAAQNLSNKKPALEIIPYQQQQQPLDLGRSSNIRSGREEKYFFAI